MSGWPVRLWLTMVGVGVGTVVAYAISGGLAEPYIIGGAIGYLVGRLTP